MEQVGTGGAGGSEPGRAEGRRGIYLRAESGSRNYKKHTRILTKRLNVSFSSML